MALSGLELFGLFAISGLISLFFPHWVPVATVNPTQREWASVFSAASLLACVISLRAYGTLAKAYAKDPVRWRRSNGPALKWTSMGVDAAAFFWSTRACTDRDTMIMTVVMAIAYLGFPVVLKSFAGGAAHPEDAGDGQLHARIVAGAAVVGLVFVLVSGAITEL